MMHWNLIHKFLSGQCSTVERREVERWLSEDPDRRVFMISMQKIWDVNPKQEGTVDVEAAWRRFQSGKMERKNKSKLIDTYDAEAPKKRTIASRSTWYKKTPIYAAVAAVLLLVVVFYAVRTQVGEPANTADITYQQITTAKGEKTSLKLSDGTRVMLNAASSLKIPSSYGKKDRTLYLQGEAFFTVAHMASIPFRVYSGRMYTEAVGTQFNVQAFAGDNTIAVVVAEGKVALGTTGAEKEPPVLVSSHERFVVSSSRNLEIQKVLDLSSYIGWTRGNLVFDDTPFRKVAEQLERWYGVECIVKNDTLFDQKLTATFENEPLSNVLKLLSKSMNINADIDKQTVVFTVHQEKPGNINNKS